MNVDPYTRWLATAPAVTLPSAEGDVIENMADTGPGLLAEFLWTGHTQPLFAVEDLSDQLPFGDFTVGRFAWLLDNVRPIDPVPMKGAQGLRDLPADVEDILAVRWAIGGGA